MARLTDEERARRVLDRALQDQQNILIALVRKRLGRMFADLAAAGNFGGARLVREQGRDLINNMKAYKS
jgi:hypothetical protein